MLFAFILLRAGPIYRLFFFRVCAASRISSTATFVKFDHFRDVRKMIVRVTNQIDAAFGESVRYSWNWSLLFTLMQKGINILFPIEKNRDHVNLGRGWPLVYTHAPARPHWNQILKPAAEGDRQFGSIPSGLPIRLLLQQFSNLVLMSAGIRPRYHIAPILLTKPLRAFVC